MDVDEIDGLRDGDIVGSADRLMEDGSAEGDMVGANVGPPNIIK